ncbi:MAG TPA: hypothetical protein VGT41_03930 [Candidatus Babeliales bacterium]|nr:hypothetical protein [Candidatus Babeliales bacterium]
MKQNITPLRVAIILCIISSTRINATTMPYDVTEEIDTAIQQQSLHANIDEIIQKLAKIIEAIVESIPFHLRKHTLANALNKLITAYIETSLQIDNLEELSTNPSQEIFTQLQQNLTAKTRKGMDRSTELILHSVANIIGTVTNACINGEKHPEIIGASVSNVCSEIVTIVAEKTRKNEATTGTVNMNVIMQHLATDPVLREAVEEIILRRAEAMKTASQGS